MYAPKFLWFFCFLPSATAPDVCSLGNHWSCQCVHAHCWSVCHSGFILSSVLLCPSSSWAEEAGGSWWVSIYVQWQMDMYILHCTHMWYAIISLLHEHEMLLLPFQHVAQSTLTLRTPFTVLPLSGFARERRPLWKATTMQRTKTPRAGYSTTIQTDGLLLEVTWLPLSLLE